MTTSDDEEDRSSGSSTATTHISETQLPPQFSPVAASSVQVGEYVLRNSPSRQQRSREVEHLIQSRRNEQQLQMIARQRTSAPARAAVEESIPPAAFATSAYRTQQPILPAVFETSAPAGAARSKKKGGNKSKNNKSTATRN